MVYKNVEDYDPSLYACYAVTSIKEDFKIYTVHPSGLKEYEDYHIYEIEDKTLIAFTKIRFFATDFVFRIVSENYTEDIQSENYEFVEDVLNDSYDKNKNGFFIMQSVSNYQEALGGIPPPVDDARRCDLEDYAAVGFLDTNKEGAPDVVDRDSSFVGENVKGWTVFLCSMANIYIVKVNYFNDISDRLYKDWPIRVNFCRTFSHAIKMTYEWNILSQDPWNSAENIAVRCSKAFADWSIPEDALEELIESQPDTVLSLYLSGDEDPRKSIEENSIVPEKFKKWYMSKLRYRTIYSLVNNYPETLSIPQSIIDKEVEFFETIVSDFLLKNALDPDTTSCVDILKIIYEFDSYEQSKNKNNSVDDIVIKYFALQEEEEKELVKQYLSLTKKALDVSKENQ